MKLSNSLENFENISLNEPEDWFSELGWLDKLKELTTEYHTDAFVALRNYHIADLHTLCEDIAKQHDRHSLEYSDTK